MYTFGSGILIGVNSVANSTPAEFGALQDVSVDVQFTNKPLYGQYQLPLTVARGQGKITGKAKFANINSNVMNSLFFNGTQATGKSVISYKEGPTPIPTTPYQITVANTATFVDDLGVYNSATGLAFTKVASAPTAGQYSVSGAGVYTFASADQVSGISVLITYRYTVAASGFTITWSNQLMGVAPNFAIEFQQTYNGKTWVWKFNSCVSNKLTLPTALDGFLIPEFDFDVFADASGTIGILSPAE